MHERDDIWKRAIHEQEIERLRIEHVHKVDLIQMDYNGRKGENLTNTMISEMMKLPEGCNKVSKGIGKTR